MPLQVLQWRSYSIIWLTNNANINLYLTSLICLRLFRKYRTLEGNTECSSRAVAKVGLSWYLHKVSNIWQGDDFKRSSSPHSEEWITRTMVLPQARRPSAREVNIIYKLTKASTSTGDFTSPTMSGLICNVLGWCVWLDDPIIGEIFHQMKIIPKRTLDTIPGVAGHFPDSGAPQIMPHLKLRIRNKNKGFWIISNVPLGLPNYMVNNSARALLYNITSKSQIGTNLR